MAKIAIVYHSGYGHTKKQAQAVCDGVNRVAGAACELISIDGEGAIDAAGWKSLDAADAIIFGTPTYMAAPSWQMKRFIDDTSKRWYTQTWKDKLAGAFTNSGSMNGDKGMTVGALFAFAMQHGMIWVGTALLPSAKKSAERNDVNFLGGYAAALAQSPSDATADEAPPPGDLETASLFGRRMAGVAQQFKR
ncbi:flavodoxin family protein [Pinirhizobacter soli]|uniref:flavodoxin family protein n=1 Tax=Pinirhizobacter soli TaxID=2786953 RepID=UPI00202A6833|nr:flavodoxin family protein [Pinirhizobacter soli]